MLIVFGSNFRGVDTAELDLPYEVASIAGVSTGQPVPLRIAFRNETLRSLNDGSFNDFIAQVLDTPLAVFGLHGGANVIAATKIGQIPITGIPFDVTTNLPGVNAFNGQATIPSPPIVVGSGGDGVNSFTEDFGADVSLARVTVACLFAHPGDSVHPSDYRRHSRESVHSFGHFEFHLVSRSVAPRSVETRLTSATVLYNNVQVGRATVNPLDLVPGQNSLPGEFHYAPPDPNQSDLVTQYLQRPAYAEGPSGLIPITVIGDAQSSPYASFIEGLEGIKLAATFPGIGAQLVNYVHIQIDLVQALCNDTVDVAVKVGRSCFFRRCVLADSVLGNADQQHAPC